MSAAALAQWLRDEAVTVTSAGFVTCDRKQVTQKGQQVTPQDHDFKRETAVCDLVTAVTAFSVEVGGKRKESRPEQTPTDPAPEPEPAPAADPNELWRQADRAYLGHHFGCRVCCSAGKGYGRRCAIGLDLWTAYEAACEADRINNPNTRGRIPR